MKKEFFDKHINMSEAEMLKGAIYSQCRIMDKEDIYNWIYEDELQLKKQKEIIDKMKATVKNDIDGFITINVHGESQEILDLLEIYLQILEDKEV